MLIFWNNRPFLLSYLHHLVLRRLIAAISVRMAFFTNWRKWYGCGLHLVFFLLFVHCVNGLFIHWFLGIFYQTFMHSCVRLRWNWVWFLLLLDYLIVFVAVDGVFCWGLADRWAVGFLERSEGILLNFHLVIIFSRQNCRWCRSDDIDFLCWKRFKFIFKENQSVIFFDFTKYS